MGRGPSRPSGRISALPARGPCDPSIPAVLPGMDPSSRSTSRRSGWWMAVASVWLVCLGVGVFGTRSSEARVDAPVAAPEQWPSDTTIVRTPGHATVLLFVEASCAEGTLRSLERVLAVTGEALEAHVLVSGPVPEHVGGRPEIWGLARSIRGVRVVTDSDEVRRFGALTSGRVLVYEANGRLGYRGSLAPTTTDWQFTRRSEAIAGLSMTKGTALDCAIAARPFGEWP